MDQIAELKSELQKVQTKMDDIHSALIGNPITKDGGLVYRVIEGEVQIQRLSDRIDDVETTQNDKIEKLEIINAKKEVKDKAFWFLVGIVITGFIGTIFQLLTNK